MRLRRRNAPSSVAITDYRTSSAKGSGRAGPRRLACRSRRMSSRPDPSIRSRNGVLRTRFPHGGHLAGHPANAAGERPTLGLSGRFPCASSRRSPSRDHDGRRRFSRPGAPATKVSSSAIRLCRGDRFAKGAGSAIGSIYGLALTAAHGVIVRGANRHRVGGQHVT